MEPIKVQSLHSKVEIESEVDLTSVSVEVGLVLGQSSVVLQRKAKENKRALCY